jgi:hypothetical protein
MLLHVITRQSTDYIIFISYSGLRVTWTNFPKYRLTLWRVHRTSTWMLPGYTFNTNNGRKVHVSSSTTLQNDSNEGYMSLLNLSCTNCIFQISIILFPERFIWLLNGWHRACVHIRYDNVTLSPLLPPPEQQKRTEGYVIVSSVHICKYEKLHTVKYHRTSWNIIILSFKTTS